MHTNIYLLITIGVLAGFLARPLNMFVFGKVVSLEKYIRRKSLLILLIICSMLTTLAVTFSSIYLSLKLSGFIRNTSHKHAVTTVTITHLRDYSDIMIYQTDTRRL